MQIAIHWHKDNVHIDGMSKSVRKSVLLINMLLYYKNILSVVNEYQIEGIKCDQYQNI